MINFVVLALCFFAVSTTAKRCQTLAIPVNINAENGAYNLPTLESNLDAVAIAQNFNNIKGTYAEELYTGTHTVTGTHTIGGVYCKPNNSVSDPTLQLLTHGIGFDKMYWDLPYNNHNYSYVDVAVDKYGFSTLAIDRFGISSSSIADPLNIVQLPAELSAIYEITMMLRQGELPDVPTAFKKVVHVGHSFGSILNFNLAAKYPSASDGLILTAFAPNASFTGTTFASWNFKLASLNQPFRFGNVNPGNLTGSLMTVLSSAIRQMGFSQSSLHSLSRSTDFANLVAGIQPDNPPHRQNLPNGYLTWTDAGDNQFSFMLPGAFDPDMLVYAEANKFPFTTGELLTLGSGAQAALEFKGPVMVFTGNEDFIFCGGDCTATGDVSLASIPALMKLAFPAAKAFEAYLQPNTGHALNLHYNATAGYNVIQQFLGAQGLASK